MLIRFNQSYSVPPGGVPIRQTNKQQVVQNRRYEQVQQGIHHQLNSDHISAFSYIFIMQATIN